MLLPAAKRVILALVQQSQGVCLRRHQDDHPIFLCFTRGLKIRRLMGNPGDRRCAGDGVSYAFSGWAERTSTFGEPSRDVTSGGKKGNP